MNNLVLIDGMFFVRRSFHSAERNMPPREDEEVWTAPTFIAFRTLQSLIKAYPAKYIFCWERGHGGRPEIFSGYKASRDKFDPDDPVFVQARNIEKMAELMGCGNAWADGFEADDVIATLCSLASAKADPASLTIFADEYEEIRIFSTDYDFFALITDKIRCWRPGIRKTPEIVAGPKDCEERMGVPPESVTALKALGGDDSDEYPGVPTGRKKVDLKAADFVLLATKFKFLTSLVEAIQDGGAYTVLIEKWEDEEVAKAKVHVLYEHLERIQVNFALAEMHKGLSVNIKHVGFQEQKFRAFLEAHDFQSVLKNFAELSKILRGESKC